VTGLDMRRQQIEFDLVDDPLEFREYWKRNYGPTIAVYNANAADPDRTAALDAAFLDFLRSWNRNGRYEAEYLLITAQKPSG
jgi:2-polyprenyl-6-hydroxyphenyl methylase/3-demethylubiquinone-9 3-methyltransferase